MGEIDEKGKEGTLNLEFHKDYLDKDKKLSPHYLKAREDMTAAQQEEDNKSGGLSFVPFGGGPPLYLKEFTFTASASNRSNQSANELKLPPIAPINLMSVEGQELIIFLRRALSFGVLSQFDYMPASAFHVSALECKDGDMSAMDKANVLSYNSFDQAKASVYVIPYYELKHKFTLKFGSLSGTFTAKKLLSALTKISFSVDFDEKFNGKQGGKASFSVQDPVKLLKKIFIKNYTIMTILIEALESTPDFIAATLPVDMGYEVKNKEIFDDIVTFSGVSLPKVTLSGSSKLKIEKNQSKIERENARLAADPLLGGEIKFNLVALLLQKVPVMRIAYAGIKSAENINDWTDKVRIDISTDKDFTSKLSTLEKAERANATAEVSLVVYAHFIIKPKLKPAIKILTSDLWIWI